MDGIGLCRLNALGDAAPIGNGKPQARIGRQLKAREAVWRQKFDIYAELIGRTRQGAQSTHHTVYLRMPRIGGDKNLHRACGQTSPLAITESLATTIAISYLNRVTVRPRRLWNAFGL
jgi:hypothetical protein